MSNRNELALPQIAMTDSRSMEIVRVWTSSENQHFVLRPNVWDDPAAWGLLLADLARHAARMYGGESAANRRAALERVLEGLKAELDAPTDQVGGS